MAYATGCKFKSAATYIPDQLVLEQIVDSKFRPQVVDQIPWFADLVVLGKAQNSSGKTVHKKSCFQVADGKRIGFGFFAGMHRPPTTITLDIAMLDERDDIKVENVGFVSARMTNSDVALQMDIGTQRIHGAGQNKVFHEGSEEVWIVECPHCHALHNLEEEFPRCYRQAVDGKPSATDPMISEDMPHDREALYYVACDQCGTPLDPEQAVFVARRPERIRQARFSFRVAQLDCTAIRTQEIVGAWYAALIDPSGEALVAFYCDRIAIPRAGAAQPITPEVIARSRKLGLADSREPIAESQPYNMSLSAGTGARVAGADMGPRCWLWADDIHSPLVSALAWAEMIPSGKFIERASLLMELLGLSCLLMDAGGEPDLTKRAALALNGLDDYAPPVVPRNELAKMTLSNIGHGLTWDGSQARWSNLRAAAVLFVAGEHKGLVQEIGVTEDGRIYPLIKCNRASAIQMAVNDFLTPAEGVAELVDMGATGNPVGELKPKSQARAVRQLPRARLPLSYIGAGGSQATVESHLLNLRKEKDPRTGLEDWATQVENHFGLAKVYARIAATLFNAPAPASGAFNPETTVATGLRDLSNFAGLGARR